MDHKFTCKEDVEGSLLVASTKVVQQDIALVYGICPKPCCPKEACQVVHDKARTYVKQVVDFSSVHEYLSVSSFDT